MKIVLKRKLFSPTIEASHKNVVFYFTKKLVQEYFAFNSERPCNPISERFNFPLLPLHDLLRLSARENERNRIRSVKFNIICT